MSHHNLDKWIGKLTGLGDSLNPESLLRWQFAQLRRSLVFAAEHSRFYRRLYAGFDLKAVDSLSALSRLPFTDGDMLRGQGATMVCLPGSQIERISTLLSSGSAGPPKRVYFSGGDLEHTVDFFDHGMRLLCGRNDSVLICMSGNTPDSVGDLLARGLKRFGAIPHIHGEINQQNLAGTAARALGLQPATIVGLPRQILLLAEYLPKLRPANVLLSADNIADTLRERLSFLWRCPVLSHWGMRETGLGGGVECAARQGHHLRHADLLIEIIEPDTSAPLPMGERGEIVVSTLRREAMPLFRYRTGDLAQLIAAPCACGGILPRLGAVRGHYRMEEKQ